MKAPKLNYGDTIGIIAPASNEERALIDAKINRLEALGFKVKKGSHLYDDNGYLAGSDVHRAKDLMEMFLDKEVKAIFCFRGGYGSMRILPLINLDIIKNNPKIFMGYSDITCVLNYISSSLGLITFHGPMVTSDLTNEHTLYSMLSSIMEGTAPYDISNPPSLPCYSNTFTNAEGILVGGNLSLIAATLGTPYEIDTKDKILFLEDVGEEPYSIDRMLTQLELSNKLKACRGFILGQFTDCAPSKNKRSLSLDRVLYEKILSLNKPTLINFMAGHDTPNLTLPIGAKVTINGKKKNILVMENSVI